MNDIETEAIGHSSINISSEVLSSGGEDVVVSQPPFVSMSNKWKISIKKDIAFCKLLDGSLPNLEVWFTDLLDEFDRGIKSLVPRTTREALSNCHGDWYEWLLAISAWNRFVNSIGSDRISNIALLLPNVSQFNAYSLYDSKREGYIADLGAKLSALGVELVTSNPDFVIFNGSKFVEQARLSWLDLSPIALLTPEVLHKLEKAHQVMVGSCDLDDLVGYFSVKSSLRPDRRLQISHEWSLMKAMYVHMQTREWILNPKGIKYYAISTKITGADRTGLKTVATHSITTVSTVPMAAVDDAFGINSLSEANEVFERIL